MPNNNPPIDCPNCDGKVIEKQGKKKDGTFYHFWGCSNFATKGCRFTWSPEEEKEKESERQEGFLENEQLKRMITGLIQIYTILEEIRDLLKPKS